MSSSSSPSPAGATYFLILSTVTVSLERVLLQDGCGSILYTTSLILELTVQGPLHGLRKLFLCPGRVTGVSSHTFDPMSKVFFG